MIFNFLKPKPKTIQIKQKTKEELLKEEEQNALYEEYNKLSEKVYIINLTNFIKFCDFDGLYMNYILYENNASSTLEKELWDWYRSSYTEYRFELFQKIIQQKHFNVKTITRRKLVMSDYFFTPLEHEDEQEYIFKGTVRLKPSNYEKFLS